MCHTSAKCYNRVEVALKLCWMAVGEKQCLLEGSIHFGGLKFNFLMQLHKSYQISLQYFRGMEFPHSVKLTQCE